MTTGELIANYIKLRDKANDIKNKHKEELAPYNSAMQQIEDHIQKVMDESDLENLKSDAGTAYKSVQTSVTVADWDPFKEYIITTGSWHMLDKRANKTAVSEALDETGELPPGLDMKRSIKINIRRS